MPTYKRRKRKSTKAALGVRGGFINKAALQKRGANFVLKHATAKNIEKIIEGTVEHVAGGNADVASTVLKKLAKPTAVRIAKNMSVKLTEAPSDGVTSPANVEIPSLIQTGVRSVSGSNGLYTAREHRVHFESGNKPGKWLRNMARTGGFHADKILDTTESIGLTSTSRNLLTVKGGLNQKTQIGVGTNYFSWSLQDLYDKLSMSTFDSSLIKEQIAYAAVSKLRSTATITSLNKYVPTYVKLSLVKVIPTSELWTNTIVDALNTDLVTPTQIDGAMPVFLQQDAATTDLLGTTVRVDPKSSGIKAADKFKVATEIIVSKTIKLPAGDRIKLSYDHLCGSGVRLDLIHGMERDGSFLNDKPVTYNLLVEFWGEEVDAYSEPNVDRVIKGTCPSVIQFEFTKTIEGMAPPKTIETSFNTSADKGYLGQQFALRAFTKTPLTEQVRRYFGTYADLTTSGGTGYRVPILSDATASLAGKVNQ